MKNNWHEQYKKRYKELKEKGKSFFPYTVFKDTVAVFIIFLVLGLLAFFVGAKLEDLADPTDANYNPRPEWYFLFLFQSLKLFPGHLEAVAAVVLPSLIVGFLILVPFLDRGPKRHPLERPLWTGLGIVGLCAFVFLTWEGLTSPLTNPVIEKNPLAMSGLRLYRELKCAYCHKIGGEGGRVGPELDKIVGEETDEWLERHFRDPQTESPGSAMPKLNLLNEEIKALVAYMKFIGSKPFSEEAPKLFAENCAACHRIGQEGGDAGPDLSRIGSARNKNYIRTYVEDPTKVNPNSSMPTYKDQLTNLEIEELARYLASLKEP